MELDAAEAMARDLMARHRLDGWRFAWDRAVRRAGQTRFRDRTITLSRHLTALHDEPAVRDTVLHEIAHALVGPRHGHDATWRRTALRIGASGSRCLDDDAPKVEGRWRGECPRGHVVTRHRAPTRVTSCRECRRGFDPRFLHTWTRDGETVPMHPGYVAELARLRAAGAAGTGDSSAPDQPGIGVGDRVRIVAPGRYDGRTGTVTQRRRTRFAVDLGRVVVTVPFALVVPEGSGGGRRRV